MKKTGKLKITDVQTENGKKVRVEMATMCTVEGTEDDYTVKFDEIFAEDMKSSTTVHVTKGSCVLLLRQGSVNTEMVIEKMKRHNCVYSTPYGDIMMGIQASEIVSRLKEKSLYLKMCYKIDYYGNVAQDKEMILEAEYADEDSRKETEQ